MGGFRLLLDTTRRLTSRMGPLGTSVALHGTLGAVLAGTLVSGSVEPTPVRLTSRVEATVPLDEHEPIVPPPLLIERPDDEPIVEEEPDTMITWTEPPIDPPKRVPCATIGLDNPAIPVRLRPPPSTGPVVPAVVPPASLFAPPATVRPRGASRGARSLPDNAPPTYPPLAERRGLCGAVRLGIHVDAAGAVSDVEVLESSGHELLDRAARRAALRWRYEPSLSDGQAVACVVRRTVRFVL